MKRQPMKLHWALLSSVGSILYGTDVVAENGRNPSVARISEGRGRAAERWEQSGGRRGGWRVHAETYAEMSK